MRKRNKQSGFTFMELMAALIVVMILVAVVILATHGLYSKSRGTTMSVDIHTVQSAVDAYMSQSLKAPTETGALPPAGEYTLIDFSATFAQEKFYPDFLAKLPRHWDESVWRLDSAAGVSVDMAPDEY